MHSKKRQTLARSLYYYSICDSRKNNQDCWNHMPLRRSVLDKEGNSYLESIKRSEQTLHFWSNWYRFIGQLSIRTPKIKRPRNSKLNCTHKWIFEYACFFSACQFNQDYPRKNCTEVGNLRLRFTFRFWCCFQKEFSWPIERIGSI